MLGRCLLTCLLGLGPSEGKKVGVKLGVVEILGWCLVCTKLKSYYSRQKYAEVIGEDDWTWLFHTLSILGRTGGSAYFRQSNTRASRKECISTPYSFNRILDTLTTLDLGPETELEKIDWIHNMLQFRKQKEHVVSLSPVHQFQMECLTSTPHEPHG